MTLQETIRNILGILILTSFSVQGQELDSLAFVYQKILDNDEFVDKIKDKPELLCDSTLIFQRSTIWEPTNLRFDDKTLLFDTTITDCPVLKIKVKPLNKSRFEILAYITKSFPPLEEGGCFRKMTVTYKCKLVTRKNEWKFKNVEIKSIDGLLMTL
jgi:hypothetical protein